MVRICFVTAFSARFRAIWGLSAGRWGLWGGAEAHTGSLRPFLRVSGLQVVSGAFVQPLQAL